MNYVVMSMGLLILGLPYTCLALYSNDFSVTWSPQNVRSISNDRGWQIMLTNDTG